MVTDYSGTGGCGVQCGGSATNKQRYDSSKWDEMGFHVSTDGDISHESKCYEFLMMRKTQRHTRCQDLVQCSRTPHKAKPLDRG